MSLLDRLKRVSGFGSESPKTDPRTPISPRTNVWQEVFDPNTNPAMKRSGRNFYDTVDDPKSAPSVMDYQVAHDKASGKEIKPAAFSGPSSNKDVMDASDLKKLFDHGRLDRIMAAADKNKDGKIDYADFCKLLRADNC